MVLKRLMTIGGALALAGCGVSATSLRDESPAERCANAMRAAMPQAQIAITGQTAADDSTHDLNTIKAKAQGVIQAKPEGGSKPESGPKPGPVAMECTFHDGVLAQLSWLAGPEAAAR